MKTTSSSIALITGASSGIGLQIARQLAAMKYDLILVSNQESQLATVSRELSESFSIRTWSYFMDLCQADAATSLYEWCHTNQLEVEILVNNAGIFFFGEVVEIDIIKTQNILALHVATPVQLCTLFGKDMKQRRSGHILIISSLSAYMPYPGIALYAATKRFLKSFARSLRSEMLDYHVNVTSVCPGAVATNLYELSEKKLNSAIRFGIMMRPEKLARKILQAMFRRKSTIIPGLMNKIFLPIIVIIPHGIIVLVRRYSRLLPPDKTKD